MKKIIILIPVFNDWDSLKKLLNKIEESLKNLPNIIVEIFIVNDASTIIQPDFKKPEINSLLLTIYYNHLDLNYE